MAHPHGWVVLQGIGRRLLSVLRKLERQRALDLELRRVEKDVEHAQQRLERLEAETFEALRKEAFRIVVVERRR